MKFGKLPDIEGVDFNLPPDPPETHSFLQSLEPALHQASIYVGCTGWNMPQWVGSVYPKGTKSKDYLLYYGKQFNTIELNTTHYRIPNTETVEKWRDSVPEDFRFCPKIPQSISHSRDLAAGNNLVDEFCSAIGLMGTKLGCCFMQLSPYFGINRIPVLTHFLENFPDHIPIAIELRHESWFLSDNCVMKMLQLLRKHNAATVITDVAGRRDVLHMGLSNEKVLIRFVGNGLHPTDFDRIDNWVKRCKQWVANGIKEIYFFTHEPDNILAPELARYLVHSIKNHFSVKVRGPELIENNQGEQMSLF